MSLWQKGHVSGKELVGGRPRRRRSVSSKSRSDRGRCRGKGCSQREVRRSLQEARRIRLSESIEGQEGVHGQRLSLASEGALEGR
jgi:hypothetical protein